MRIRGLLPPLPRELWVLNVGMAINVLGGGMVAPFLLIYLHNVRGFSLEVAGLVPAVHFATALVFGLVSGAFFDRVGGKATGALALGVLAVGYGLFPLVEEPWHALALGAVSGAGRGAYWPSYSGLLAALSTPEQRPAVYAVQRILGNVGIGLGALAGGLIVSASAPATFTVVFLASAAGNLVLAASFALVPSVPADPAAAGVPAPGAGGYRAVLRDRPFLVLVLLNLGYVTAGGALLNTILPLYAKNDVGVDERVIGLVLAVNTSAIVLAQLPVTRLLAGRRRMPSLALMGAVFAVAWLLALAAGAETARAAAGLLLAVAVVFAVGECIHGVVQGPLVADLAPAAVRGRYMAAWLTTAQLGFGAGPALGALVLAFSATALWLGAAAVCAGLGFVALALERRLPEQVRRAPRHERPAPAVL